MRARARTLSLSWYLAALCLGLALPLVAFTAVTAWYYASAEKQRLERDMRSVNQQVVYALDREITAQRARLRALATSSSLGEGDYARFHRDATELSLLEGNDTRFVLRHSNGPIIVDTSREAAEPARHPQQPVPTDAKIMIGPNAEVSGLIRGGSFADSALISRSRWAGATVKATSSRCAFRSLGWQR